MSNLRRTLFESLLRLENEEKYANLELNAVLAREEMPNVERALFTRLFYGVIERQVSLDYLIDAFSKVKGRKIEQKVRVLLRMGLYQILYVDSIPDHAAVNETVNLAKELCHAGVSGYVNGILRAAIRNRDNLPLPPQGSEERLAFDSGLPIWICRMWSEQYGARAEEMALATMLPPPLTLRVNTLRLTAKELLARLAENGISAELTETSTGVRLTGACPIRELKALEEGLCFVQDEASQICAAALGAKPGEDILDACACPGGKSFSIAMDMENRGRLVSADLHESKLSLVREGAERLGIVCLETQARDGRVVREGEQYDRILCDVPCSGLGVMAKKPDLRHKKPEELARLPEIQRAILEASAKSLRSGGVLVYSTCTLNVAENEAIVEAFLAAHADFSLCGEGMENGEAMRTLFPIRGQRDGFFLAKLKKK